MIKPNGIRFKSLISCSLNEQAPIRFGFLLVPPSPLNKTQYKISRKCIRIHPKCIRAKGGFEASFAA